MQFDDKNRTYRKWREEATQQDVDKGYATYVGEILPKPKKERATKWKRMKDADGNWIFTLRDLSEQRQFEFQEQLKKQRERERQLRLEAIELNNEFN